MDELKQPLEDIASLWNDWRRQSGEPLSLAKIASVLAALYGYQKFTPNTNWDKPAVGLAGIAALLGASIPRQDEVEQGRQEFARELARCFLAMPHSDDALQWFEQLPRPSQVLLAQLLHEQPIQDVANFIADQRNRQQADKVLRTVGKLVSSDPPSNSLNQLTIDKSASLIPEVPNSLFSNLLSGGTGFRCSVKTPYIEIQSSQGKIRVPTTSITTVVIIKYHGHFGRVKRIQAWIQTLDSEYRGDLLTTHVQVEATSGVQLPSSTIELSTLGAIAADLSLLKSGRVHAISKGYSA
ncbi:MAG: hypothetical protein M1470_05245 [Bacteroidetes bacterium]|nr:hypothetical protein [Bacteroidota bacterium]